MIHTRISNCSLMGYVPSADLPCSVWTEFLKIWANIFKCANFTSKKPWIVCFFWKIKTTGNTGLTFPHGNNWLGLKWGMGTSTHHMLLLHTHARALTRSRARAPFKDWPPDAGSPRRVFELHPVPRNHSASAPQHSFLTCHAFLPFDLKVNFILLIKHMTSPVGPSPPPPQTLYNIWIH